MIAIFFLEKTLNIPEGHTKIFTCTTCGLNIKKNQPDVAKIANSGKFFNAGKT